MAAINPSRRSELDINPHIAQWAIQSLVRGAGTLGMIMGVNIIVGGLARWSGRSYATALLVPGAPASWGIALLIFGAAAVAATFLGRLRLVSVAMYCLAAWSLFFSLAFGKTAIDDDRASTGGFWSYLGISIGCIVLGSAYWQSTKSDWRGR